MTEEKRCEASQRSEHQYNICEHGLYVCPICFELIAKVSSDLAEARSILQKWQNWIDTRHIDQDPPEDEGWKYEVTKKFLARTKKENK